MDEQLEQLVIDGGFTPRHYQLGYMNARDQGCPFIVWVCHRRGGKDRTALAQAAKDAFKRVGLYWHCLPTLRQGRKVIWDAITADGQNLVRQTFPDVLVKKRLEDEMKLELVNGSIVQIVGADNFDSLMGAAPVHVTFSEWALTDPRAYDFVRPILRENRGSVSFIFTPRGYNHGWKIYKVAEKLEQAWSAIMTVDDTQVLSPGDIAMERAMDMPEELIQQEYFCDFSAANVGAIVGRYMSLAEREGRINEDVQLEAGAKVVVSCDIGYRDAAAFWFWQLRIGGFELVHYEEGTGRDAPEWIDHLKGLSLPISHVYLPHDATAKTFQTRHSVIEQFAQAFECSIVPKVKLQDRINAARMVIPRCAFNKDRTARGLEALRAWSFKWDDERREFSSEPDHNWSSHGSDAFSYGALVMREMVREQPKPADPVWDGKFYPFNLEDLHQMNGERVWRV